MGENADFSPRATVRRGGGKILTNLAFTASERTRNTFGFFPRGERVHVWGKNADVSPKCEGAREGGGGYVHTRVLHHRRRIPLLSVQPALQTDPRG